MDWLQLVRSSRQDPNHKNIVKLGSDACRQGRRELALGILGPERCRRSAHGVAKNRTRCGGSTEPRRNVVITGNTDATQYRAVLSISYRGHAHEQRLHAAARGADSVRGGFKSLQSGESLLHRILDQHRRFGTNAGRAGEELAAAGAIAWGCVALLAIARDQNVAHTLTIDHRIFSTRGTEYRDRCECTGSDCIVQQIFCG